MSEPENAVVEKRARALAEQDGYTWELTYKPVIPGAPIKLQRFLNEKRRQEYKAQARAELLRESGHA